MRAILDDHYSTTLENPWPLSQGMNYAVGLASKNFARYHGLKVVVSLHCLGWLLSVKNICYAYLGKVFL